MADQTGFLRNCPTVCYLLAATLAIIVCCLTMGALGCWLAILLGIIAFLLLGWVLQLLLCHSPRHGGDAQAPMASDVTQPTSGNTAKPETDQNQAPAFYNARPIQVDDLKQIKGVGPKLEERLNNIGVYQLAQIANWTAADIEMADARLNFKGRITRDEWPKQAKALITQNKTK